MGNAASVRALRVLALAATVRRAVDVAHHVRFRRWERRMVVSRGAADASDAEVTVIVPVYDEASIAEEMVDHWARLVQEVGGVRVTFVTTAKEEGGPGSTHAALERADGVVDRPLTIQRCDTIHRFRCKQLDLVLDVLARAVPPDRRSRHWIAVYNADSKPEPATFTELKQRAEEGQHVRAYQQLVRYHRPATRPSPWYMSGFPAYQTWWTETRYFARQQRGLRPSWWGRVSPYSTFGHGEFLRLDLALEMGSFPSYAYADGILLGWELRAARERIGLLAARDWAETPRSIRHLVLQHRAWMRGLFGSPEVFLRPRPGLPNRLSRGDRRVLVAQHTAVVSLWGLRPFVAAAGLAALTSSVWRHPRAIVPLIAIFGAYLAVPAIAYQRRVAHSMPTAETYAQSERLATMVLSAGVVTLVDGAALPLALYDHLFGRSRPPRKTPR